MAWQRDISPTEGNWEGKRLPVYINGIKKRKHCLDGICFDSYMFANPKTEIFLLPIESFYLSIFSIDLMNLNYMFFNLS